jgi:hypothetical protein
MGYAKFPEMIHVEAGVYRYDDMKDNRKAPVMLIYRKMQM